MYGGLPRGRSGKEFACQLEIQELQIWFLGLKGPLQEEIAIRSCILAWRIPWTEEPGRHSSWDREESNTTEHTHTHTHTHLPWMELKIMSLNVWKMRKNFKSQFSSVAQSCPTCCKPMNCSTPGLPVHHQLPEFTQTHVHRVGDAIQPSHPLSSPSTFNLSQHQGVFKWVSFCIRWPKFWSFSFSISPSNEYSELISFRMNWLDLIAVQGTLKSLLQHHSSKASILQRSAFFL